MSTPINKPDFVNDQYLAHFKRLIDDGNTPEAVRFLLKESIAINVTDTNMKQLWDDRADVACKYLSSTPGKS